MSDRRALIDEVIELRSREVALTPALEAEAPGSALWWQFGLARWASGAPLRGPGRRQRALECCAIALAWLEAIDDEVTARSEFRGSG